MALIRHLFNKSRNLLINNLRLTNTSRLLFSDEISFIKKHNTLDENTKKRIEDEVQKETKNWISYGFSFTDKDEDKFQFVAINLVLISFFGCTMAFMLIFYPKQKEKDWAMREAYLELARREKLGLHLIDPNFIPIERINLPTDEELGGFKLIL